MKKLICIAIVLISLFSLMVPAMAAGKKYSDVDMWVNCSNGKRLNVREAPNSGARRITQLECGTKVHVDYDAGNGWVAISDYHYSGYVQAKFLVEKKPGKYEITERDDNFKAVKNPYIVVAKALNDKTDRSVGLRVKPNKTAKQIRRLEEGDRLQVIAKGNTWFQVVDLQTGKTGYVAKQYVQKI